MNKPTFKHICLMHMQQLTNFPYIEKDFDALTDYGLLCKVVDYLNQVIASENAQNENILALYNAFTELKNYVENFFDNLDVQDEINNKLDEMVSDGTLDNIISRYINSSVKMYFPVTDTYGDLSVLEFKNKNIKENCIIDFADDVGYNGYLYIKNKLINKGYNKFKYAIISHYHQDHIGNLLYMLNDSDFDFSECTFYVPPTPDYERFIGSASYVPETEEEILNTLESKNIPYIHVTNNTVVNVFDDINISFLNADTSVYPTYYETTSYSSSISGQMTNYNNFSIVAQINHKNQRLLFTGDIEKQAEDVIISQGLQIPDLLKIEHHGLTGKEQYSENYVNKYWFPKIAIGLSKNDSDFIYIRRKSKDIETYYTFASGDIEVISSGYNLLATSENGKYNPNITQERYNIIKGITGYLNIAETNAPHYIESDEDLNDYTTSGTYACLTQAISNTILNKPPINVGFKLIVLVTTIPEHIVQYLIQNRTSKTWVRYGNKEENETSYTFSNWSTYDMLTNFLLTTGADLDNVPIGSYTTYSAEMSNTILNKPSMIGSGPFSVITRVLTDRSNRLIQILSVNNGNNEIYIRTKSEENGWNSWCQLDTMKNKLIPNNSNLDNLDVGNWCSNASAQTSTLSNVPTGVTGGFNLECRYLTWNNEARLIQKLIPNIAEPKIYIRTKSGDNWGNWYVFTGSIVN